MNILRLLRRFVPPYIKELVLNLLFNVLSTVLSLFSFAAIVPILRLLFGLNSAALEYVDPATVSGVDQTIAALKNNMYWLVGEQVSVHGTGWVLFLLGLFLVVMTALKCLCAWLASYHMVSIRTGVLRDLRQSLYNKIVSLPISFFTQEKKGDIMSRMTSDVGEVENSIMASLDMIIKDPLMIFIYLLILFLLSWRLTLFVLVLLPISGWVIGKIGRSLKRRSTKGQEQTAELLTQIEETLSGLRIVKAFNAEQKLRARFRGLNDDTRRTFNRIHRRYALAHPVSELLGTLVIAILLWYGGGLILAEHSSIDAAEFIYYLVIFYSIINPAKDLTKATYSVRKGMASLERIDKILNTKNNIIEPEQPEQLDLNELGSKPLISYRNVSFAYTPGVPVLRNISFDVYPGQTVAFVGQSGSGKTTLVDLLPRFYDVTEGEILVGGVNIKQLMTRDLRELMGNVNQDAILFNDTFFNNIAFGVNDATAEQVENAAKVANAHDFIVATADGYETLVGDRGSRLSGGQRQRVSIARAILKNPAILILDEATSALDTESEQLVKQALDRLMCDRTTLVVAHRLSTIRDADLICVLHEGQIVERGTHQQLIALGGHYAKLVEMQQK